MLAEITLQNGIDNVEWVTGTSVLIPIRLQNDEKSNMDLSITALAAIDDTNKGWLIDSTNLIYAQPINLNSSSVDENVTAYDKGGVILDSSAAHTPLSALVESIIARKQELNAGDIIAWFVIKKVNATDFLFEAIVYDRQNEIETVDVVFIDFGSPAPVPTELPGLTPAIVSPNVKLFSTTSLTFEDTVLAVGLTYRIVVDFKDINSQSVGTINYIDLVIQDL